MHGTINLLYDQMDDIDLFRNQFYDKLIAEEQRKEQEQALIERTCFHKYDREIPSLLEGYRRFACSKCGRTTLRRWNTQKYPGLSTSTGATCSIM